MTPDRRIGEALYGIVEELFPICRSITGNGLRETLARLQQLVPVMLHEVPTGTQVFDWHVPREWNIRDAYVMDSHGQRVIDFQKSNLHVVNYSVPVDRRISLDELREHLHTVPTQPDLIPYRTSYYAEQWGFCLRHRDLATLTEPEYQVRIDSTLTPGTMTFGECLIPGGSTEEVLISAHVCHPSLANDNLSGIAIATLLARQLMRAPRRYTYRFLFIPGTIGSITWLARNRGSVDRIKHGLVLSCLGDPGHMTYKRSRRASAVIDRAAAHVLAQSGDAFEVQEFSPFGNDERQFCSPGFDLPVGALSRTPPERYREYHTSADDLSLVRPEHLADAFNKCLHIVEVLEHDRYYVNLNPWCEPQLGKRGLYRTTGGQNHLPARELALLWVLNQSDGRHSLLDIAERAGMDFSVVLAATRDLVEANLVEERGTGITAFRRAHALLDSLPRLTLDRTPSPPTSLPSAEALT